MFSPMNFSIENESFTLFLILISLLILWLIIYFVKNKFLLAAVEQRMENALKNRRYDEVIKIGLNELNKNHDQYFSYAYLGQAYEKKNDMKNAIHYSLEAATIVQNKPKLYCDLIYKIAGFYEVNKNPSEALLHYTLVYIKDPSRVEVLYDIARIQSAMKNYKKALESLEKLLKHKPKLTLARFLYAKLLYQMGDNPRAMHEFDLLSNHESINHEISYYRARVLENLGHYSEAEKSYRVFYQYEDTTPKQKEKILVHLIQVAIKMKDFKKALKEITEYYPTLKTPDVKKNMLYLEASVHWEMGDEYTALKKYDELYRIAPQYKDVTMIHRKYSNVLERAELEQYFTIDESVFDRTCKHMLKTTGVTLLHSNEMYFIYYQEGEYMIFYRHIDPITSSLLNKMETFINSHNLYKHNIDLYSLYGVTEDAQSHPLLRKMILMRGKTFCEAITGTSAPSDVTLF